MARIYLSSTYSDLKEYREQVYRALRSLKHDVIAMEDYSATGQHPPLDQCLADVSECDLYVGIFAWRYGYIPGKGNPEQKSITELEYRKARENNKPCFIFLLNEHTKWSPDWMDVKTGEGERGQLISAFRQEFSETKLVKFFDTPEDLANSVNTAIALWERQKEYDPESLEKLKLDQQSITRIEQINLNLEIVENYYRKNGFPSDHQASEFKETKRKARLLAINLNNRVVAK